jgi:PilZ domain
MPSTTANSERRNSARKRPPSLIYVELSGGNGGMMRDLSEEGFALRAMMPLHEGEEISFSFLLDPVTRIEGQGAVLWVEENGRVAGARFTELPARERKQIGSWLNDELQSQDAEKNAPADPDAKNFEMLREKLRSAPPRPEPSKPKAGKSKWPVARPGNAPSAEPFIAPHGETKEIPDESQPSTASGTGIEWSRPADSGSSPRLPDFSDTQVEITFDHLASSPKPAFPSDHAQRRSEVTSFPKRSEVAPPKGPALPDISEILMQPPRRPGYPSSSPVLEPLPPANLHPRNTRSFSLSQALTIMVALALVVGGFVYRDMLGEGLVWLGQQIGGGQNQAITPSPKQESQTGETNSQSSSAPASTPSSTAPAPATTAVPAPETPEKDTSAAGASPYSTTPHAELPTLEKKPQAPVTPLSGIASAQASDTGQEAGSAEYAQAMQLLHDGVATDSSEAVRLLWISVEKGNPNAELTLAELYWRGQGVARNCDQTGILLGAAARKGNVDAQKRLKQFRQEGCE